MSSLIDRARLALARRIAPRRRDQSQPQAQPPGGFNFGTQSQWYGGPAYSDVFQSRRAPTPYELVERYGRLIYAMATRNANAVSRLPLRLYMDGSRAQGGRPRSACDPIKVARRQAERHARAGMVSASAISEVYEVRTHPMLDALDRSDPYGYFDRRSLLALLTISMDVLGSAFLVPDGGSGWDWRAGRLGSGPPESLWLMYAQYVISVPWPSSPLVKEWWYFADHLPFESVLWFRQGISLRNPYGGSYSPAYAGDQYQDQEGRFVAWYDQFFGGAKPNLVASPRDPMMPPGEDVRKRHEQDLNRRHAGGNAGNAIVTDGSYEYTSINYPPTDEGGVKLAEYDLYRLASIFGQPPTFYTVDTNLANLQAADEQHARNGVEPRCWAIAGKLTRFTQAFDPRLYWAFDPAIQEDSESREKVFTMMLASGRATINEVNEEDRWSPKKWGNEPWLPGTLKQPTMLQEAHEQGLATAQAGIEQGQAKAENETAMTEFQTSEEPAVDDEAETKRALLARLEVLRGRLAS